MVGGQRRQVVHIEQRGGARVAAGSKLQLVTGHRRVEGDRDDALARITVRTAERAQLLQVPRTHAGLLPELPPGRTLQALPDLDETAGHGPHAHERLAGAPDQQNLQPVGVERENENVDGHRRMRVFIGIGHTLLPALRPGYCNYDTKTPASGARAGNL